MKERIQIELSKLQQECNVRILLAVESGSRAWGIASEDSDYDVRLVYAGTLESYLKLEKTKDVINWILDDVLDIVGWNMDKFLRLLRGSNPSAIEWLSSSIIYDEAPLFAPIRELASQCYSPKASAFHYLGMLHGEEKAIHKASEVSAKTYLYAIRALLAAKWSLHESVPAPMLFEELVDAELEPRFREDAQRILETKLSGEERCFVKRIPQLDEWLASQGELFYEQARMLPAPDKVPWSILDDVFLSILT